MQRVLKPYLNKTLKGQERDEGVEEGDEEEDKEDEEGCVVRDTTFINLLAPELFFLILAHTVYKM